MVNGQCYRVMITHTKQLTSDEKVESIFQLTYFMINSEKNSQLYDSKFSLELNFKKGLR